MFARPSTWIVIIGGIAYFLFDQVVALAAVGRPVVVAPGEIAATVAADHLFLIVVLLSASLSSSVADAQRLVRPDRLGRLGGYRQALLRGGLLEGLTRSGQLVLALLVIWTVLTAATELSSAPRIRLYPRLASDTGTLVALLIAHAARLILALTAIRMLVLSIAFVSPMAVPWAAVALWCTVAVTDFVDDQLPRGLTPMALLSLITHADDPALQVRWFSVLLAAIAVLLALAGVADVLHRNSRDHRVAGLREALGQRSSHSAALLAAVFVLVAAITAALPGQGSSFGGFIHLMFDGYGGTLLQASTEALLTVGFAAAVFLRLDDRRRDGWTDLVLLRLGSRAALLFRTLRIELPRVLRYAAAIAALAMLGFGLGNGGFGGTATGHDATGYQLLVNGTLQILLYTTLVVLACTLSDSRIWPVGALLFCLAVPMPGEVFGWLPLHRAGLAPLESGGWAWALHVSAQSLVTLIALILAGIGIARFLDHRIRVPRRTS